jgi:uncharacterized protein (DUF3820 family)
MLRDAMQLKSITWWLWLIPIAVLVIAVQRMPYGYYTFTRILVCVIATFLAWIGWEDSPSTRMWSMILGLIAVLFNPIFPIYLTRGTWYYLDLCAAVIFAGHLAFVRLEWLQTKSS